MTSLPSGVTAHNSLLTESAISSLDKAQLQGSDPSTGTLLNPQDTQTPRETFQPVPNPDRKKPQKDLFVPGFKVATRMEAFFHKESHGKEDKGDEFLPGRFQLHKRNFSHNGTISHWNHLPRELGDSTALEIFKIQLFRGLAHLV